MSQNIYWAPVGKGGRIDCDTPSSTIAALERGFGTLPCAMGVEHIAGLKFMEAADPRNEFYRDLIDLIEKHEQIRVWVE